MADKGWLCRELHPPGRHGTRAKPPGASARDASQFLLMGVDAHATWHGHLARGKKTEMPAPSGHDHEPPRRGGAAYGSDRRAADWSVT